MLKNKSKTKLNLMLKVFSLFILLLSIGFSANCQLDTSYLYVNNLRLKSYVSNYEFLNITITNGKDSLVYTNINKTKPFAIKKSSTFKMIINSQNNSIVVDNLNEILATSEEHAIYIEINNSEKNCVWITYLNEKGEELMAHSMYKDFVVNGNRITDCGYNSVNASPSWFKEKRKFRYLG
jgi:hypothetical protein